MEIGWPTDIRDVAHVTFDCFNGILGLPVEFEFEIPCWVPSARYPKQKNKSILPYLVINLFLDNIQKDKRGSLNIFNAKHILDGLLCKQPIATLMCNLLCIHIQFQFI